MWDMQKECCPNVKGADKADKVTIELPKTSVSNIGTKTEGKLVTVNGKTYYQTPSRSPRPARARVGAGYFRHMGEQ